MTEEIKGLIAGVAVTAHSSDYLLTSDLGRQVLGNGIMFAPAEQFGRQIA